MKIERAYCIVTCPGRNFVTLKIVTDQGVHGLGDATLNGREKSVLSYLEDHVIPCLIGRDPQQIEDIWQYLAKGAYWRRGPVTMTAIAAVDTALWDIKAKLANMPLYQLLGGKSRSAVMVYGHANGRDIPEAIDAVGHYLSLGYKAIRAQAGVPGLDTAYGVAKRIWRHLAINITRIKIVVPISCFNHCDRWILGGREGEGAREQAQEIQRFGHSFPRV